MDKFNNDNLDLDNLKSLWQNRIEEQVQNNSLFNNDKILIIMKEKTSSAVKKVRRNLLIEILVTIPMFIGTYFLFAATGIHLPFAGWLVFLLVTFGYHIYMYWKLQNEEVPLETVSENINKQHKELSGFMKMYEITALVLGFLSCITIGTFLYLFSAKSIFLLPVYAIISLSSGYGLYVFVKWYAHKLYGQHYSVIGESKKVLEQN